MNLSSTNRLSTLIYVVVPLTVKSPPMVAPLVTVKLFKVETSADKVPPTVKLF
jgi:hypothetical protein